MTRNALNQATLASLAMYDLPHLQAANDALWSAIAGRLRAWGLPAPTALTRGRDLHGVWRDPGLLLAQSCGYPVMTELTKVVQIVATPRYRAPGCEGAFHRSAFVVAAANPASSLADLHGARCAINEPGSNTGMNLLRAEVSRLAAGRGFFAQVDITGSHAASLAAVAAGHSDLASIDAVTFAHLQDLDPSLAGKVRVLAWSRPSPGLPLVTSARASKAELSVLRQALAEVAGDPALAQTRDVLRLEGFDVLPEVTYGELLDLQRLASDRGYPQLI